jgi:hypothetical protein
MEPTDTSLKQTGEPAFSPDQFANDLREAMTSWNRAYALEAHLNRQIPFLDIDALCLRTTKGVL